MHSGASEYVKSTQRFLYSCKCGKRPWISHIFYHLGRTTWSVWRLVPLIFFFLSLKKPLNEDWRKHPYILKRTVTQTHRTSGLWSREQCSARPSDRSPSFTFSLPVFYLPLSSLCSIPSGPGPEQLSSASTDSSWTHTHALFTHNNLHSCFPHTHTHSEHFIHCLRLIFFPHLFESRPLRVHTNADLETQKIRHLNSDWRETHPSEWGNLVEKRQHTFLRDGRQALEGKLNLSKDAVGGIEKRLSFCVVQRAPFTYPQIFFLNMFLFMVHSLKFSSRGGENWAEDVCLELQVRIFRMDGWGDEEAPHSNLLLKKIFKCL